MGDFHSSDRGSPEASDIFNDRRPPEPLIPLVMDPGWEAFLQLFHQIEKITFTTFFSLPDEIAVANKREGRYPKELRKKIDLVFAVARMMKLPDMVLAKFMDEIREKLAIDRRKNCAPWWEDLF